MEPIIGVGETEEPRCSPQKSSKNYGQETITRTREGWDVQEFLKIFESLIRFTTSAIQN